MRENQFNLLWHPTPMEIADYIDGRLDEADMNLVEAHLKDCFSCRRELKDLRDEFALIDKKVPELWDNFLHIHQGILRIPEPLQYAAAHKHEIGARLDRMSDEFKQNPILFEVGYTGHLHPLSESSAILEFRKAGQPASEVDGKKIEISLREELSEGEPFVDIIRNEEVRIDFAKLGVTIENYNKLKYKLYFDESTIIEGTFGDE